MQKHDETDDAAHQPTKERESGSGTTMLSAFYPMPPGMFWRRTSLSRSTSRLAAYLISILVALAATVGLSIVLLHPPRNDLLILAQLLGVTGLVSAVVGFLSFRMGWWRRLSSLNVALTLGYLLAGGLTLLNVWVTAQLMFINEHDLALGALLLVFAGAISVAFGYFISDSITQAVRDLVAGAGRVSEGDFSARVEVEGKDEIARLAGAFNEMAARLAAAAARAEAADSARRNLVAWASHDLRTPLASLRAMIDALAEGVVSDQESVARYLRQSQGEIARMSALIDDLFDLAQMDAGIVLHCEVSSLGDLLSDTLAACAARAQERGVTLSGSVAPGVDPVWMASDKISRVLNNLLDNALRHTPGGGTITLSAALEDRKVHVSIRDTGAGIAAEDMPHIFERFYRGEKSRSRDGYAGGGAGLGLAIAQRLAEAHGGSMWAESTPGSGTTLHFTLPKSKEDAPHEENSESRVAVGDAGSVADSGRLHFAAGGIDAGGRSTASGASGDGDGAQPVDGADRGTRRHTAASEGGDC